MNTKIFEVVMQMNDKLTPATKAMGAKGVPAVSKLATAFKGLVLAIAGLAIMRQITRWMLDATKASIAYERSLTSLESLMWGSGEAAQGLLADMQALTLNQVSLADLSSATNRAVALIGTEAIPKMRELTQVATISAQVMGTTVAQALDSLSIGIGRQSRLILDNLGLIVSAEEAYQNYATMLDVNVEALTETERKQAFLNETLAQANEKYANVAAMADPLQVLKAAWDDLQVSIGDWIAQSPKVNGVLITLATEMFDLRDGIDAARDSSEDLVGEAFVKIAIGGVWVIKIAYGIRDAFKAAALAIDYAALAMLTFINFAKKQPLIAFIANPALAVGAALMPQGGIDTAIIAVTDRIAELGVELEAGGAAQMDFNELIEELNNVTAGASNSMNNLGNSLDDTNKDLDDMADAAGGAADAVTALVGAVEKLAGLSGPEKPGATFAEYYRRARGVSQLNEQAGLFDGLNEKQINVILGNTGKGEKGSPFYDPKGGGDNWYDKFDNENFYASAITTAGNGGGVADFLPLIGSAFGPVGGAIGGVLGGLFKKKTRGNTQNNPVYVHMVNTRDLATVMLNVGKVLWAGAGAAGVNDITTQLRLQIPRVGSN